MNEQTRITIEDADTRARFTTREFVHMIDAGAFDDMKVELIRGELERMPPPDTRHGTWQIRIIAELLAIFGVTRVFAEVGIELSDTTLVGCDAVVVHAQITENRRLKSTDAALVVEVAVSSVGRDLGLKRTLYAEAGIATYWVVDPERGVTHVYREPTGGEYRLVSTVPFDQPLDVPGSDATITLA